MKYDVKVPAVGESITEATIGSWQKKNGEAVKRNDVLLLLETDKASVEVVAEQDGVLNIAVEAGKTIPIGSVIGSIDGDAKATAKPTEPAAQPKAGATQIQPRAEAASASGAYASSSAGASTHLSPAVQKIVTEKGIDPTTVAGTGKDGRLTKGDVLSATPAVAKAPSAPQPGATPAPSADEKRVPMSTIRKRIAERLVFSQQSTATLTTFNEIDMSKVMALRSRYKDQFKEKYPAPLFSQLAP